MSKTFKIKSFSENKKQSITRLAMLLAIIVFVNVISSFVFTRFDLTSEKRFTLSTATREFLHNLKDVVYVKVYLEGDFPAGFKRLRNSTKEMLDEFKAYAKDNIEYEFINPSASTDQKERNQLYNQLAQKGLQPTNLEQRGKEESSQRIIFPGAILTYRGEEVPLQLLKSQLGTAPEVMLNNSIQSLEFSMANAIRELTITRKPKIGFLQGHRELNKMQVGDLLRSLTDFYDVDSVMISGRLKSLHKFSALVIAKPDSAFSEKDKFIIDQFVMHGGKVLWLIDQMDATMDSLSKGGVNVAIAKSLNLDDQLFRYGVRINADLIEDLQAAPIPIITGYVGNQPQQKLMPWYYYPLLMPTSTHPIVNNLNAVRCEFVSSIDTLAISNIKKTVLLASSKFSRLLLAPVRLSLNILRYDPDPTLYNKGAVPVAVLLEGQFQSVFTNRIPPVIAADKEIDFKPQSIPNKMIVIADGDIIRNNIRKDGKAIYPLGYDRFSGETFGNKSFLLNCVDYLCDDSGLISVRSKELKLRLLNKSAVDEQKLLWQIINTCVPLLLIVTLGITLNMIRKKRFAS
jgi:ABC-2 type transport system permease protein